MSAQDDLKRELVQLEQDADTILGLMNEKANVLIVGSKYQDWYTRALKVVANLAPDRLEEFRRYYEPDPKRKELTSINYAIQDYLRGIGAKLDYSKKPLWNSHVTASFMFVNQINILNSLVSRIEGILSNIELGLLTEIQDAELTTAQRLKRTNIRAAGALAGVVLEDHLQRVAVNHNVKIAKRNPTIADLNDPLRQADVYDMAAWRKIQYLADVRNLCSHKKDREPTGDEVTELIDGVRWAIKNRPYRD